MQYIVIFSTWEYTGTNDTLNVRPWKLPMSEMAPLLVSRENRWRLVNYEALQPPLYYLLAGACWRAGLMAGFHDDFVVYLLRLLNAVFIMALVWLGWRVAELIFPEIFFIRCAVAALLAVIPQSIFYFISNDILSPLCFGAVFYFVMKWLNSKIPSMPLAAATGLALAATFLAKNTNLPLLAVSGVVLGLKSWTLFKKETFTAFRAPIVLFFLCATLPGTVWMIWCKIHFGNFIGGEGVARAMNWTVKPFSQ
jgi:hypothetical protein